MYIRRYGCLLIAIVLLLYLSASHPFGQRSSANVRTVIVIDSEPQPPQPEPMQMIKMLQNAESIAGSGLRQPGFIIWGGSVIKGRADGLYHIFVSRWDEKLAHMAWVTSSEIAHAVSSSPLGPWRFQDVALPRRGCGKYWDGCMTHNPSIHWHARRKEYVLFYTGTNYDFTAPAGRPLTNRTQYELAWNSKRIGVATSKSPNGPWRRSHSPILTPRKGHWDGGITSNPSAVIYPDGSVLLVYKSIIKAYPDRNTMKPKPVFHLGGAVARDVLGPYRRAQDSPVLRFNGLALAAEDPYVWRCAATGRLHLIFKAMNTLRTPPPERRLVVPSGHLAYTYTAPGGSLMTWSLPQLAFNRTLRVRSMRPWEQAAARSSLRTMDRSSEMPRRPGWWTSLFGGGPSANDAPKHRDASRSLPAIPALMRGVYFKVDRLERPQFLFSRDNQTKMRPTYCFAAMMVNGSSANVVLRLGPPPERGRSRAIGHRL